MRIRRVDIANFRGIKSLSWRLPVDQKFVALLGPGDSGKSTILTAIDMALSDRWTLSVTDNDFYLGDVTQPISIRVALTDLPGDVTRHNILGMHQSGIDPAGDWHHDPEDHHDPCVIIGLTVADELEPAWTIHRPGDDGEERPVSASARRLLGVLKVDERIDAHLRWSRTSALTRLTEAKHGTTGLLTHAARTARQAVTDSIPLELSELTEEVKRSLHAFGAGNFTELQAGLDQSLSGSTGNLALYDGPVPLTGLGLGSRRLAGVATQQLAHHGQTILLIDELEYGLEPHRVVGLLNELRRSGNHSHVLVTTHSPTALQYLDVSDLAIVRNVAGHVNVQPLGAQDTDLQKVLRAAPAAFLARQIVLTEGKTEYGIVLELLEATDLGRVGTGDPTSAALGVVAVESGGGSSAIHRARALRLAGYDVILFVDSDVAAVCSEADDLVELGVTVIRWADERHTERAAVEVMDAAGLTKLIIAAVALADHPEQAESNLLDQLRNLGLPENLMDLDVGSWTTTGYELEAARTIVAKAAHKHSWFKRVDKGRVLMQIMSRGAHLSDSDTGTQLDQLRRAVYETGTEQDDVEALVLPDALLAGR